MEGSPDDHVIVAVPVDVQNRDGVSEVGPHLGPGEVVKLKKSSSGQENNLDKGKKEQLVKF